MQDPTVSVVVAVYNGARFLGEAIRSILAQDYPFVETVVVDDGSTDDSLAIARSFPEVVCLAREQGGPGAARNLGVEHATGSLVTFLDADDVMWPTRISTQVSYLREHPEFDCVLCLQRFVVDGVDDADVPKADLHGRTEGSGPFEAVTRQEAQPLSMMGPRDLFDLVGPFEENIVLHDDGDWLVRAFNQGVRFGTVREILMDRRMHGDNLTLRNSSSRALLQLVRRKLDQRRAT